ncbi:MAG: hypothetical protein AAGJ08_19740 [Cyanobacteria bacterium P01_H01_bin.35]
MSTSSIKLNHSHVFSQLASDRINKLLKSFGIEAIVFLTKMPATQWFDQAPCAKNFHASRLQVLWVLPQRP